MCSFASSHHRITPIVDFDSACVSVCLGACKKGSPDIPLSNSILFRSEVENKHFQGFQRWIGRWTNRWTDPLKETHLTNRPKARDGHRYPCPALVFCNGSCYVSRAAVPEGTRGDYFSLDVLIKDVLNKENCMPFHFRQYRGFSKHRVASIGSCFFVGIHVDIQVHIHRKHFVDLDCHAVSLT